MQKEDKVFYVKIRQRGNLIPFLSLFLFLISISMSCESPSTEPVKVGLSFYHWQTRFDLTALEENYLDSLSVNRLYVKFFDIDKTAAHNFPSPVALLEVDTASDIPPEIIPTVFITNRSLRGLGENETNVLAERIYKLILTLSQQMDTEKIKGIQIDCDWSSQTQARYFQLLSTLRDQWMPPEMELSATIRLHQLKYADDTGVPPVDRGMLMFYNMGEVTEWEESNSILNNETAAKYIPSRYDYPLSLDLALPLFHWGVLFRKGKMIKLINGLSSQDLLDQERFRQVDSSHFEVIRSTYLEGYYLYRGDQLRLEVSKMEDLSVAVEMLRSYFPRKSFTLAYYHLDTPNLKRFPHAVLSKLAKQFE